MSIHVIPKPHLTHYVELWTDYLDWSHAPSEDLLNEVNEWVKNNELGHRMSYNGWKLRDAGAVTMFTLRWQQI